MATKERTDHDAATRSDVQHILDERVRRKLPRHIKDSATLDRIAFLIEGAAPAQKKRARKAA